MATKHECSATVHGPRVQSWPCGRPGVLREKCPYHGKLKWYCRQHAPSAAAARRAKSDERYRKERQAEARRWNRDAERRNLMAFMLTVPEDDLPLGARPIVARYRLNTEPS